MLGEVIMTKKGIQYLLDQTRNNPVYMRDVVQKSLTEDGFGKVIYFELMGICKEDDGTSSAYFSLEDENNNVFDWIIEVDHFGRVLEND